MIQPWVGSKTDVKDQVEKKYRSASQRSITKVIIRALKDYKAQKIVALDGPRKSSRNRFIGRKDAYLTIQS